MPVFMAEFEDRKPVFRIPYSILNTVNCIPGTVLRSGNRAPKLRVPKLRGIC